MGVYNIDGVSLSSSRTIPFEYGGIESNGALSNVASTTVQRSQMVYECDGGGSVGVKFETAGTISSAKVVFYSSSGSYVSSTDLTVSDMSATFTAPANAKYFKLAAVCNKEIIALADSVNEAYNPYIVNSTIGSSAAFVYKVGFNAYTSGRLLLPPNYSMTGDSVPLIVFGHGSGGMSTWDSEIGYAGSDADYRTYLVYLANEGFAVFDCYPWTNRQQLPSGNIWSPYGVQVNFQSYIEGVKYCCSRFNVNIDKVNLVCKSQGGHLGHWACTQSIFPFRTVALQAPSPGIGKNSIGFNANLRTAIVKNVEFYGTDEEKAAFIETGHYVTPEIKAFCDKNKVQFLNLMPYAHGVTNSQLDDFYALNFEFIDAVPQWMLDEGLPAKPSGAAGIGAICNHPEYIKHITCPVKFWAAMDDEATSSYMNYTICRWMQNGGGDALFRVLPLNTGKHHATDSDPAALKSSGTTALGITYTNIPTAYVELVEFIRLKCGD